MIVEATKSSTVTLTVRDATLAIRHFELSSDNGVFVGTSSNCGLQLEGEGLNDIHCHIGLENGKLWLQDWMSAEGTRLNGETIAARSEVKLGDVIQIGQSRITASHGHSTIEPKEQQIEDIEDGRTMVDDEPFVQSDDSSPVSSSSDDARCFDEPANQIGQSSGSNSDDHEAIGFDVDFEFDYEQEDTYDRETVELLRAEIEDLQAALAQRDSDQRWDRNEQQHQAVDATVASENSDTTLKRMQELIDEANRSDERVSLLEELLHVAEDTNRSEREERTQLEAWVGDIEKRIGQREDEHAAELESLRNRLEESDLQQDRLRRQIQLAAFSGSAPKQYEQTLENLQASNRKLQEQISESNKQRLALEQRLAQVSDDQDRALREERTSIAKEQAKLSRLRYEISKKLADVEELPKTENATDKEAAHRIRTLREHLREIHEQEKVEEKEASLATRLAKLWKRVEY